MSFRFRIARSGKNQISTANRVAVLAILATTSGCASMDPGVDKLAHMTAGVAASKYVTHRTGSPLAGCMASIMLGIAKEAYDSTGRGTVDGNDAIATAAGAGCAFSFTF